MEKTDTTSLNCFKAYDVRGQLGDEFNEKIAYRIGRAVADCLKVESVVIGYDARSTSESIAASVSKAVQDAGANSYSIGLSGTEEVYWATANFGFSAGIMITASHNPIDYNGLKIVKNGSKPLNKQEFANIKRLAESKVFSNKHAKGKFFKIAEVARQSYLEKILNFIQLGSLKPLKIVLNTGNGAGGPTLRALVSLIEKSGTKTNIRIINEKPDPTFPQGIPNPLLLENQSKTSEIVIKEKADFGIAFDGDFDRCFFFDDKGKFIKGEYIVGLLAQSFLAKQKQAAVVYDPRITWNVVDQIEAAGGKAILSKTGHIFIKRAMRKNKAIYGGELSAHHYFRDFAYCDSGMIPWLLMWELISKNSKSLREMIEVRQRHFISSGELNFEVTDPEKCLLCARTSFNEGALEINEIDGISIAFKNWRFNLRKSNTEALVRVNIETLEDSKLLEEKINELTEFVKRF